MNLFRKKKTNEHSDEELMCALMRKDHDALDELYRRYYQKINAFFYRAFNGDADKAADFLQDIFIKLIDKAELFNPEKKFSTWLFAIASNMVKNEYRRITVHPTYGDQSLQYLCNQSHIDLFSDLDREVTETKLHQELNQLGDKHKTVVILRYQQEKSLKEISRILNISEGTVKSRLFYALKKLSVQLKDYQPILN